MLQAGIGDAGIVQAQFNKLRTGRARCCTPRSPISVESRISFRRFVKPARFFRWSSLTARAVKRNLNQRARTPCAPCRRSIAPNPRPRHRPCRSTARTCFSSGGLVDESRKMNRGIRQRGAQSVDTRLRGAAIPQIDFTQLGKCFSFSRPAFETWCGRGSGTRGPSCPRDDRARRR